MSRHRNIRNLDFDDEIGSDEDADYYGRSYDEDMALSPNSARFIYRRDGENPYFRHESESIPEESFHETHNYHEDTFQFEDERIKVDEPKTEVKVPVTNVTSVSSSIAKFTLGGSGSSTPEKSAKVLPEPVNPSLSALLTSTPYKKRQRPEGGKENLNLVIVGHVDAGKSTLMGHLLLQLGFVEQRVINKYKHEASKLGKGSFAFAWVLDETEEERERGVTMDIARTYFETTNKKVVLLDAPGHKDFIPNMITGASQADAALLVVNATRGEFETGFDQGGQTREHVMLLRSFGVTRVAVAINKMDTVRWSEGRFNEIVAKMKQFLMKQAGFPNVHFVPLSGLDGINLTKRPGTAAPLTTWYNGPTLVEVIDGLPSAEHSVEAPLRVVISDVVKSSDTAIQVCAKVEGGHIEAGDRVIILPGIVPATVKQACCENSESTNEVCFAGDQCLITLSGQFEADSITSGHVISRGGEDCLKPGTHFLVRIVTFNITIPFLKGTRAELFAHSMCCTSTISKLVATLNKSNGEVIKQKPRCINRHTSGLIEIKTEVPIALEAYKSCKTLGRITLRDKGETVAAGIIEQVLK
ncbi:hypothetical protein QR680_009159 [Steinernema hermaphroditum]|uniref:Tr-type G domain-containing protein n=1 Tax=Steinernema hermaphroditum TaxID=289476 RepID=A0AA39M967_9BILA|nr:hypothetical protein QR680_009159 [Steinernema hermaphroditum]